ncbi:hypothetical protein [Alysiella crassa]|nr:hypothetical protein [Alysiella crassa]
MRRAHQIHEIIKFYGKVGAHSAPYDYNRFAHVLRQPETPPHI